MPKKVIGLNVLTLYEQLHAQIEESRRRRKLRLLCACIPTSLSEDLKLVGVTAISGVPLEPSVGEAILIFGDGSVERVPPERTRSPRRSAAARKTRRAKPTLVYGEVNDQLLFVEEDTARELAALWKAKTWGELKGNAPRLFREAIELLQEAAEEQEWADEENAQPFRHPQDSDAFDVTSIPGVEDGDWPDFVAQRMLMLLPSAVVKKFGTIAQTAINGEMLQLDPADEKRIVKALEQAGHTCRRDNLLIRRVVDMP